MTTRDAYIQRTKLQLDELNQKMAKLEARAKEARADAHEKYQEELAKLRQQSKLALAKLDDLKAASEDGWQALRAEMEKLGDAFKHSFNYFKSQV